MAFHRGGLPARIARIAALALLIVAAGSATARADGIVQIGGQTVDLSQLGKPDVNDRAYNTVTTPGGSPQTVIVTGYSLPKLFKYVNAGLKNPLTFGSAEILAPEGTPPVVLTSTQATIPSEYQGGGGPPVVWADGAGTHFLVPSTPSGNTNAGETFTGPGGTITIELHQGPALSIGVFGPVKAYVGKPVTYTASVYGGADYQYQWSFGDSSASSQAAPSHIFTAVGTYDVYVQVTGSSDSVGASSVTPVVVGNAPPTPSPSGAGTGGNGTGSGGGSGGGQGSGSGAGAGSQTTSTTAGKAHVPASRSHRAPAKRSTRHRAPAPVGPVVSGVAISYIAPATGATGGAAGGAAGAARAAHLRANAKGLREGMWIWLGVLVALFAGGLLELRGQLWRGPVPMAEAS